MIQYLFAVRATKQRRFHVSQVVHHLLAFAHGEVNLLFIVISVDKSAAGSVLPNAATMTTAWFHIVRGAVGLWLGD